MKKKITNAAIFAFIVMFHPIAFAQGGVLTGVITVVSKINDVLVGPLGQGMASLALIILALLFIFGIISLRAGMGLLFGIGLLWGAPATVAALWG